MRAVVVIGGGPPPVAVALHLGPADLVVAADSGLDHARALGLGVDLVVGDLDSVSAAALDAAGAAGAAIERHPRDKDATDVELAVTAALDRGASVLTVVGGAGDRVDHVLGALAVLASPSLAAVSVDAWLGRAWLGVVHGPGRRLVQGTPGEYVSLVPLGGPARGVRTAGLRWALGGETLAASGTRGISNELVDSTAEVTLVDGTLLLVRPYALGDDG